MRGELFLGGAVALGAVFTLAAIPSAESFENKPLRHFVATVDAPDVSRLQVVVPTQDTLVTVDLAGGPYRNADHIVTELSAELARQGVVGTHRGNLLDTSWVSAATMTDAPKP